ncbi:hypothetical protein GCM10010495_78090 [Kitasatospora herbaricolor]|uniref:hypothetical protein n=1 Tax=Kitasatospora herbaricolor TaxID=68217 RepID=UPI0017485EFB|nr:hypothetical protein [Kitasatospora herbaricolor]MDQ0312395.1 hypothetical protein [Kitasatospora herbaricolor]GGV48660.1 hypothetical protein GCM10010495_78090 [Kitasatospora herbaricolor]
MSFSSGPFVPRAERHLPLDGPPFTGPPLDGPPLTGAAHRGAVRTGVVHRDQPVRRASPDGCSPWIVTLRTRHSDGRSGTHSFVEWALTSPQAIASAVRRAATPVARRRRRDAVVEVDATAVAEFWPDVRSSTHPGGPYALPGEVPHPRPAAVGGAARDHGDPRRYWAGGANVYALSARAGAWAEPGSPGEKGAPAEPGAARGGRDVRDGAGPVAHC